jgi:hypothetical protein
MLTPIENPDRDGRGIVEWLSIAVALLAFLTLCWALGAAFGLW